MSIENQVISDPRHGVTREAEAVVPLDQRLQLPAAESHLDPQFRKFYSTFMDWINKNLTGPKDRVQNYLKQLTNPEGEQLYGTAKKQMDVLTQVMVMMKELRMEESEAYTEISSALVSVAAANMFFLEFLQHVFAPSDDEESRENSDW